ncbi:hypothetical protein [Corallincola luteus]|nr:hypothetical protein [Corallincola luteus]
MTLNMIGGSLAFGHLTQYFMAFIVSLSLLLSSADLFAAAKARPPITSSKYPVKLKPFWAKPMSQRILPSTKPDYKPYDPYAYGSKESKQREPLLVPRGDAARTGQDLDLNLLRPIEIQPRVYPCADGYEYNPASLRCQPTP